MTGGRICCLSPQSVEMQFSTLAPSETAFAHRYLQINPSVLSLWSVTRTNFLQRSHFTKFVTSLQQPEHPTTAARAMKGK